MTFGISMISVSLLVAVIAWVLANHWHETHGENHY